jgi:hypothetical protein
MTDNQLKIKAVIGFSGGVRDSLAYTPCGRYLVYPLGAFVVIKSTRCILCCAGHRDASPTSVRPSVHSRSLLSLAPLSPP